MTTSQQESVVFKPVCISRKYSYRYRLGFVRFIVFNATFNSFIYIIAVSFISGVYRTKALLYAKIKISSTKDKFFIIITEKSFLK